MVAAVATSLGWIAFQLPRVKNRRAFIVAVGLVAAFLSTGLLVSVDLDEPYAGHEQLKPSAITSTEKDITKEPHVAPAEGPSR